MRDGSTIEREPGAAASPPRARRVVILGGGFAGVSTARYLSRMLGRRADVEVELLSEENYFLFQPLLPEVAAGGIDPNHVVNPVRELVPRVRFRWCRIEGIAEDRKVVMVAQGEGRDLVEVPYDHLVFALGKIGEVSSMPGVEQHGLAMKSLTDAFQLRNHVLRCLELADIEKDPAERRALLTFAVAGGGFSGVETIGELSEMLRRSVGAFPTVSMNDVRLVLIHSRDRVLPEMAPDLGESAGRIVARRGIEIIVNTRLRAATRHGVYLTSGRFLPARTLVCTVGNAANPVVKGLLAGGGFAEATHNGRPVGAFATDLTLQVAGRPGYWAVGDAAGVPDPENPAELCPPTAQFAVRQAKTCARNVLAAFRHRSMGMLASLGGYSAVADVFGFRFSGFPAWVAWRAVYWAKLPGVARKANVMFDWILDLVFRRDIAQLGTMAERKPLRIDHYEPGETIIAAGEIGREFFLVQRGEVDVFRSGVRESEDETLATLGPGEVFGERALLEDTRRVASVRARTAVDVLVLRRDEFAALVDHFPVLDDYLASLMKQRYRRDAADNATSAEAA
jgi:NADH dehydrogenase